MPSHRTSYPLTRTLSYAAANPLLGGAAGVSAPAFILSNAAVFDNATVGSLVGVLSTINTTGTYTYSFLSNPGNLFAIAGSNLNVAAALSAGNKPVSIRASGGVPTPLDQAFNITVSVTVTAPSNSVPPGISGTAMVGQTLTVTSNGTWAGSPAPTYSYQWRRGGVDISGATANTYLLTPADISATMTCAVTGVNTGGSATSVSNSLGPIAASSTIPSNSIPPVISGSITTGGLLTVTSNGTWAGSPAPTYTYQWKRGAANIGTGASSYTTVTADEGSNITCVVTGTNVAGNANATSNSLGPITAPVAGAIVLAWTSDYTVYDPVFTLTTYAGVVGDILTLQIDDNSDFSSLYTSQANTLDSGEATAGTISYAGITTLLPGVTYYARVKLTRASVDSYSNAVSQTMYIDNIPPTVVSFVPADNATSIPISVELVATFSETVVLGSGTISLKKTSDNSTVDSWNVASSVGSGAGQVQIIGGTALHIHPTVNLANSTEYYVVWPAGVVKDVAGNNVAAQSSTTIWSFTTGAPVAVSWVATASPAVANVGYANAPAVFSSVAINNTSISDVIIVFVGSAYQHVISVTVDDGSGPVAMTPVSDSDSAAGGIQIWKLTGHVLTTVTVRVSSSSNLHYVGITVGYLTGVNYAEVSTATKSGGFGGDPQLATSALAVPVGGRGLGAIYYQTDPTVVWNTGVKDYVVGAGVGTGFAMSTGYYTAATTPQFSIGSYNFAAIATAAWGL